MVSSVLLARKFAAATYIDRPWSRRHPGSFQLGVALNVSTGAQVVRASASGMIPSPGSVIMGRFSARGSATVAAKSETVLARAAVHAEFLWQDTRSNRALEPSRLSSVLTCHQGARLSAGR